MRRVMLAAMLLWVSAAAATAQDTGARNTVVSTNALGFLQLGPNVEMERAVGDAGAWALGARLPSLGLTSHVINDGIQSGWTVYGAWHFYPAKTRLGRWFVGPHLEYGGTTNETYTSKLLGGGAEFGYRWIKPSRFTIALGGLVGGFKSDDTWRDGTGSAGNETYALWMLNLSFGFAR